MLGFRVLGSGMRVVASCMSCRQRAAYAVPERGLEIGNLQTGFSYSYQVSKNWGTPFGAHMWDCSVAVRFVLMLGPPICGNTKWHLQIPQPEVAFFSC